MEQKIYPINNQKIKEVHVKEGDVVKAGDIILEYDTTAQSLSLETKRTEVELARTAVLVAERELNEMKTIVPVENMPQPEPTTEAPTTEAVPTTEEAPNGDTTVSTSTDATPNGNDNTAKDGGNTVNNVPAAEGTPTSEGTGENASGQPNSDAVNTSEQQNDAADTGDTPPEENGGTDEVYYTRDELNKMITDKQNEIKSLNTAYQLKEIEYEIMENQLSNGQITANFDGVVKTVKNEEDAISENTAMIVLSGTSGYTVNSSIGELSLAKISIGMEVELLCYDNGAYYTGKIMWGEIIQIKSGLSMDDYVAFPYASDVEEGMKTKHANFEGMYY